MFANCYIPFKNRTLKYKIADGRHFEKSKNRNISTTD